MPCLELPWSHLHPPLRLLPDPILLPQPPAQVCALEHDRGVVTAAFERVLRGLQGDLADVKGRLEGLRRERDGCARTHSGGFGVAPPPALASSWQVVVTGLHPLPSSHPPGTRAAAPVQPGG